MRTLLVDALNLIRRVYEALPHKDVAQATQGGEAAIRRVIEQVAPTHALCAFDSVGPTWRHRRYPAYKANRPTTPAAVIEASREIRQRLQDSGILCCAVDATEADDLIASMTHVLAHRQVSVVIASSDQGFAQLLDGPVRIWHPPTRQYRDAAWAQAHFGVPPLLIPALLALAGNPSDNIPGVPGIGRKRAAALINQYGDLHRLLAECGDIANRHGDTIRENLDDVALWYELLCLPKDIPLGINLRDAKVSNASNVR